MQYSSELVDVTVVTNKANQIQNDVPHISWLVMTAGDQGIVADVTESFQLQMGLSFPFLHATVNE